jgi:NAD(P)-dependent dehydrogenase (short-subunit alcohol dehydrogenase family)
MVAIKGSTVLVTGGQRGLGRSIVDELVSRGAAKIYATARAPLPSTDPRVVSCGLDVTEDESVSALAANAGDVDIVVNNAGAIIREPLLDSTLARTRDIFETNFFGVLRVTQAFAPILRRNGGGALVDIHSVLSWMGGFGAYGASKAAIWSATNSFRVELDRTLVIGVHLGYADTDMNAGIDVPKVAPRDVAALIADAVERDNTEVLVDDVSRTVKGALAGPVENLAGTWA